MGQENILIIGAGFAGLNAALALNAPGRTLTLIERDPPPPDASADTVFDTWERRGVGHLRHSHAFLARLYLLLRDKYPDLLSELREAGCRELHFEDGVPKTLSATYKAAPGDEDLTILTSRRTTLEFIMRGYVEKLPGVQFISRARAKGLLHERTPDGTLNITGVIIERENRSEDLKADLVVDAGGKNSLGFDWLKAQDVNVRTETQDAGIVYFTRHYRLKPGQKEPERGKVPGAADLGYIKYGIFPGDNGWFSVTLAVPEIEKELRPKIVHPEVFDTICRALPAVAPWIEETRVDPASRVFGMGNLKSQWRHLVEDAKPAVLNFYPLGDTLIRSNPLYGRGCSFAAVEAHALADALVSEQGPVKQALHYYGAVTREIRPYYDSMCRQDQAAITRAAHELDPSYRPGLKARLIKSFINDALAIALRSDITLLRQAMHGFHMLSHPEAWLKRPRNFLKIMWIWARGKKRNKAYYVPRLGPQRNEMFALLDISPAADQNRPMKAA